VVGGDGAGDDDGHGTLPLQVLIGGTAERCPGPVRYSDPRTP
jgi:hypothetical protein